MKYITHSSEIRGLCLMKWSELFYLANSQELLLISAYGPKSKVFLWSILANLLNKKSSDQIIKHKPIISEEWVMYFMIFTEKSTIAKQKKKVPMISWKGFHFFSSDYRYGFDIVLPIQSSYCVFWLVDNKYQLDCCITAVV